MPKYLVSRNPSGRPSGTGKYGEPTRTVRVPISLADEVVAYAENRGYRIPVYGNSVSAGTLTPTGSDIEDYLHLGADMLRHAAETFAVRVEGYSMQGAGILPDDLLIVDGHREAKDGDIVVAAMNGDNTVKRLRQTPTGVVLQPENPEFKPIPVTTEDEFKVQGVVVGLLRHY